jgi:ribonuclease R
MSTQQLLAALLLESRIGDQFDSIVTGASEKGIWVQLLSLPVEGKLVQGFNGIDVGDRLRVQLVDTNVERFLLHPGCDLPYNRSDTLQ